MAPGILSRLPADGGDRPDLLFVHGAWHGAWCWDEHLLPWFAAAGYPSHAVDLTGHGDDPRPLRRTTGLSHYLDDLDAAIAALDTLPILVGHSMGGLVVQKYLEGKRFPGAVLVAPMPIGGAWQTTGRVALRHPVAFLKANLTLRLRPIVASDRTVRSLLLGPDLSDADVSRYRERIGDESYRTYVDMLLRFPRPTRVLTPTLVVAAGKDRIFSVRQEQRTAQAYGTEAVVIDGAAHDLMLDPRWEAAASAILSWLEDLSN